MSSSGSCRFLVILPILLIFALAPTIGADAEGAAKKKPAAKKANSASSAQTKALAKRLKKGQAALAKAKQEVASTAAPLQAARDARDLIDKNVTDAKRAMRDIEKDFDEYVEPDSPYGKAYKAYQAAADNYEKAKEDAEAAAKAKSFKDASEHFQFVQNFPALAEATAKRTATGRRAKELREQALEESPQWSAAKRSLQQYEANLRDAEESLKSLVARNAKARSEQAAIEDAIEEIKQAGRVSVAQDKQQQAIARRKAEIQRRERAEQQRKQEEQRRRQRANQAKNRR